MSTERLIEVDNNIQYFDLLTHSCCSSSVQCAAAELPPDFRGVAKGNDCLCFKTGHTIEFHYKQASTFLFFFKWRLKASQVLYLHFAVKKRVIIHEFHEKQEQFAMLTISDKAKVAMQGYLNHFLGNIDIVNSREVCKFLDVSRLSFAQKYGPKLKEALLEDPFNTKLLDIIVFDVLPTVIGNGGSEVNLANQIKESNPLRYAFKVSCGNRSIKFRSTSKGKVKDWVAAIILIVLVLSLLQDGSQAQWFIEGQAAFKAITSSIEDAKSEVRFFLCKYTML
ncbi:hypothetical protein EZV62_006567 [Acer yangbiense]|uniref:PH domain-containing protein n=1 Tax=Acer yangbiense TaxID=1000413 RepID=A0A5C7I9F0_9ROSI|nr:hypothetical protein EZV62_006567 [Acer yangbiense]